MRLKAQNLSCLVAGLYWLWGIWALAFLLWAPSAEAAEGCLPEDTRGSWHRKEGTADGVVTGCQTACGLFEVSLAGVLAILSWYFSRGPEVLLGAGTKLVLMLLHMYLPGCWDGLVVSTSKSNPLSFSVLEKREAISSNVFLSWLQRRGMVLSLFVTMFLGGRRHTTP